MAMTSPFLSLKHDSATCAPRYRDVKDRPEAKLAALSDSWAGPRGRPGACAHDVMSPKG